MGWAKTSIVSVVTVGMLVWCGVSFAADFGGYEVVSQSDNEVTFTVRLPRYSLDTLFEDGREYVRPFAMGLVPFGETGSPDLPLFPVILAVPPGADVGLEASSYSGETLIGGVRIAPVPRVESSGQGPDGLPVFIFEEDPAVYSSASPFPAEIVRLASRGKLRHQEVIRVLVCPFVYDPVESSLRVIEEITVTLAFQGASVLRGAVPAEDAWESVYRSTVLNYEQGRRWRVAGPRTLKSAAPTNDRVKILIDATGIHRVGYEALAGIGVPEGIPVGEVFLYRDIFKQGAPDTMEMVESAIDIADNDVDGLLSPGDTITFFALDFYDQFGRRGGEDYYSNKNFYWLSWGEGEHKRIESAAGWRDSADPAKPGHFTWFIHEEKDSLFVSYPPQGDIDLYVWRRYRASFSFTVPGVDNSYPARVTAKFVSYVTHARMQTSLDFFLSGCSGVLEPIGTYAVGLPSVTTYQLPVPAGVLCEEGGVFRFESELSSSYRPGNILDWFEVAYERRYEARDDMLVFTNGGVTGEAEFEVTGFSSSDIMLFDVTDTTNPVRVTLDAGMITPGESGFDVTFRDSVGSRAEYMAITGSRLLEVLPGDMELRDPPRLRDISADHLMISHPDFIDELDPLVELRQAQGLVVEVATTEEVYDDFGNGTKSDVAIKRFVENCYLGGNTQFVLLVGDANTDRRGVHLGLPQPTMSNPAPPWPSDVDYLPSHNLYITEQRTSPNREIKPSEMWFVTMDGSGDRFPDLYIGRLPVGSAEEAAGVVDKILTFENYNGSDPWKKRMLLVADDFYRGGTSAGLCYSSSERSFEQACDSVAIIAADFAVVAPDTVRYYLRRCTRFDQPELRTDQSGACVVASKTGAYVRANCTPDLLDLLNEGSFIVNFQGHSNRQQFTWEGLIQDFDFLTGGGYRDVRDLANAGKPFVLLGFGCWISNFHDQGEGAFTMLDAIAEKFLLNPDGGACGTFASSCAEFISDNLYHNPYTIRSVYTHLQGMDVHGNPLPARVLFGEAMVTGLLRFTMPSRDEFAEKHLLLGDPAMVMDMGPPLVDVTANGSPVGEAYVYTGSDTLNLAADIRDEEAIMSIELNIVRDGAVTPVSSDFYAAKALVDTDFTRSRAYEVVYDHVPLLGDYAIEISGEDYSGKSSATEIRVQTGSAVFFKDNKVLKEGDPVVFGQKIRIEISRPVAVSESEIKAAVDTIPASEFGGYGTRMLDAEGKRWEIAFIPSLEQGDHTVTVTVQGLSAERGFEYVPVRVGVFADDRVVYENDYVSSLAEFEIVVAVGAGIGGDDLSVELDGEGVPVTFAADPTGTVFTASFAVNLDPGEHELTVRVFEVSVGTVFRVSGNLVLMDVSVFPNPFSDDTYFFYTLSQDAEEVGLAIYTISGRLIFEGDMPATTGYNQYLWDGRDMTLDRIANGTYLYRIVAKTRSQERESTGWLVKME